MAKDPNLFIAPPLGFVLDAPHPGALLADEIAARGLTAHALALKLRVPANRITEIVNARRGITPETALRLSRYLGTSAKFWMGLQVAFDLEQTQGKVGAIVDREVEKAA